MKRIAISSTTVAAVGVSALFLLPKTVDASTPKETFKLMRTAIGMAANRGELELKVTGNGDGTFRATGSLNGSAIPPEFPINVTVMNEKDQVTFMVSVDFEETSYSSIKYGKDKQTLVLVPKQNPAKKYEVKLDPRSMMPAQWSSYSKKSNQWQLAKSSSMTPPSVEKPVKSNDFRFKAKIVFPSASMPLDGTAIIKVYSDLGSKPSKS